MPIFMEQGTTANNFHVYKITSNISDAFLKASLGQIEKRRLYLIRAKLWERKDKIEAEEKKFEEKRNKAADFLFTRDRIFLRKKIRRETFRNCIQEGMVVETKFDRQRNYSQL